MSHLRAAAVQGSGEAVRPLAGVRVLELGRLFAAPFAAQLLADFGAEVIKVERPGRGDEFRHYAPRTVRDAEGRECAESANYISVNRNKRSITVDLRTAEGQDIVRELARSVDVVIENFKVGALARYGLDHAAIKALNPAVIYASITGFGQDGPYADRPGTDAIFQAMSGLMSLTGEPDGPPQRVGVMISDMVTGFYAAISVLMALRAREVQGAGGRHVDVALLDCAIAAVAPRAIEHLISGVTPTRLGSRAQGSAPSQIFRCKDGLLQMQATTEPDFRRLCRVMDLPGLADDPRFGSRMDRYANVEALADLLEARFRTATVADWHARFVAAGLISAPIYTLDQTFADPQVRHRGLHVRLNRPGSAEVAVVANPIRFDGRPLADYRAPPLLGEHTQMVLAEMLQFAPERIEDLKRRGVV